MKAKALSCCILTLTLLLCSSDVWAQDDEPGLGGAPEEVAKPPPPTPPAPPDPGQTAPAPAPSPADEPVPPPDGSLRTIAQARQVCLPGRACPLLSKLIALLSSRRAGVAAATILGGTRDRRAVMPLAQTAAYGRTARLRRAAKSSLARLAGTTPVRSYIRRAARLDPDPRTKAMLMAAFMGVGVRSPRRHTDADLGVDLDLEGSPEGRHRKAALPGQRTKFSFPDPDSPRVIYGQTAFRRKKGVWDWTITQLGLWNFDYGVTDWLEVGVEAAPPIFAFTMFPHVKIGTQLGKNVSMAVRVMGGLAYPYIEDSDTHFGIFGGGPILTIGDADMAFTFSWPVYAATVVERDKMRYDPVTAEVSGPENEYHTFWITLPHLGFSTRLHKRVKLNFELYAVAAEDFEYNGEFFLFMYGIRIMGEHIFGDINFVMPLWEEADEVLQYMPIGFPLLQFGFQW